MKLIILAAGMGSRLAPLTNEIPKCMVELKGKPLILWQIETAKSLGINDIIVIRGYKGEKLDFLKEYGVKLLDNQMYKDTNMVETLFEARKYFNDEIIISYGDIVYEKDVLKAIMKDINDISIIVDHGWQEYWEMRVDDIFSDAESLIIDESGKIKSIGKKVNDINLIQGQYIGLLKFTLKGLGILENIYDNIDKKNIYMTDLIQEVINKGYDVYENPIYRKWVEIDTITDLKLAEELSQNNNDTINIK